MKNKKTIIAWGMLILLLCLIVGISYVKFSNTSNKKKENPAPIATQTKEENLIISEVANDFNSSQELKNLESQEKITIKGEGKDTSLYVTYKDQNESTTYEFVNTGKTLTISVSNSKENLEKFKKVFAVLVKTTQKKLNNTNEIEIDKMIDDLFENHTAYNAMSVEVGDTINTYYIETEFKLEMPTEETNTATEEQQTE